MSPGHGCATFGRHLLLRLIGRFRLVALASFGERHRRTMLAVRCEHTMEACEVDAGLRYQSGQLVFDSKSFLGVLSIRDVAQTVGEKHAKKDVMVNVLGGLTLVLTLGVLALLVFQIPRMFDVAQRVLE